HAARSEALLNARLSQLRSLYLVRLRNKRVLELAAIRVGEAASFAGVCPKVGEHAGVLKTASRRKARVPDDSTDNQVRNQAKILTYARGEDHRPKGGVSPAVCGEMALRHRMQFFLNRRHVLLRPPEIDE